MQDLKTRIDTMERVLNTRIDIVERDLRLLRDVCWPVCQLYREQSQLSNITDKKKVLNNLPNDEAFSLLKAKNKIAPNMELRKGRLNEEWELISREDI